MNPQNQKQPCEPGRVARFADRWNKPAIGSNRNLGLGMRMSNGMSLAALVLGTAGSALAADLTVSMMPSHHQNEHYAKAVVGQPIQVWGKASGGDYAGYTIDFGDGSAPATGDSVMDPSFVGSEHAYQLPGEYLATLSITNTAGAVFERSATISVRSNPDQQTKIDIANEKALVYLYRNRTVTANGTCWKPTEDAGKVIAATASAAIAYEKNGHLRSNNPIADVYQELVSDAIRYLLSNGLYTNPEYAFAPGIVLPESFYITTSSLEAHCLAAIAILNDAPLLEAPDNISYTAWWIGSYGYRSASFMADLTFHREINYWPEFVDTSHGASTWGSLLWKTYKEKTDQLPETIRNLRQNVIQMQVQVPQFVAGTWQDYMAFELTPNARDLAGASLGAQFLGIQYNGVSAADSKLASVWLEPGIGGYRGWAGRMDSIFLIANSIGSGAGPDLGENRDSFSSLASWLLGEPEVSTGSGVAIPDSEQVAVSVRDLSNAYGQNPDGSWRSDGTASTAYHVSSPFACTGLAVSALTRTNLFPSYSQLSTEYGVVNNAPVLGSTVGFSGRKTLSVDLRDEDLDTLEVDWTFLPSNIVVHQVLRSGALPACKSSIVIPDTVSNWNNQVSVTVSDRKGTPVTRVMTVTDSEPPVINPIADIAVNLGDTDNFVVVQKPTVTATDNSGFTPGVDIISWPAENKFYVGSTPLDVRAVDRFGNFSEKTFVVKIGDVSAPVVFQASDVYINSDPGKSYGTVLGNLIPSNPANDNSGLLPTIVVSGYGPNNQFPIGDNVITVTATDSSNNSSTMSFHVFVADQEAPAVTLSTTRLLVSCDTGKDFATVPQTQLPTITALDNSGNRPTVIVSGIPDQHLFPLGTTRVTVKAVDARGNSVSTGYDVVVEDKELPTVSQYPDMNAMVIGNANSAAVRLPLPDAKDNSGEVTWEYHDGTALLCSSDSAGSLQRMFIIGTHNIRLVVSDKSGNQVQRTFVVKIRDLTPPTLTKPDDITVNFQSGRSGEYVNLPVPVVTDNSGSVSWAYTWGAVSYTSSGVGSPGRVFFPIGTNLVQLTASDLSMNSTSCTVKVIVLDNEAPVVSPVAPITVTAALGKSNAPVTIPGFSASDNSGVFIRWVIVPNVSTNMVSGTGLYLTFPIGSTSVRYVATDPFGNSSFVTSTVTVRDVELPKFVYIPPVSVSSGTAGSVTLSSSDLISKLSAAGLKVTDNEGKTPTLTISSTVPSTFNKGTTTWIPITATDSSGNSTMGPFALRVL